MKLLGGADKSGSECGLRLTLLRSHEQKLDGGHDNLSPEAAGRAMAIKQLELAYFMDLVLTSHRFLVIGQERLHQRECGAICAFTCCRGRYGAIRGRNEERYEQSSMYLWTRVLTSITCAEAEQQASKPR